MIGKKPKHDIVIPPQRITRTIITVGGPLLVVHRFDEKAKKQMLDKQMGVAQGPLPDRNPQEEYEASKYLDTKGRDGFPARLFKEAMIMAGSFIPSITKVQIRGGVFVCGPNRDNQGDELVLLRYESVTMRQDIVRLQNGIPTNRFRAAYIDWEADLQLEFDPDVFSPEQVHYLLQRAGFSVGAGENRPEKTGATWGRFEIKAGKAKKRAAA